MRHSTSFKRLSGGLALATLALGGFAGCMDSDKNSAPTMTPAAAKTVTVTIKAKPNPFTSFASGRYGTGPATPGNSHTFQFYAPKDGRLSFASMFGQSNDWFFAPDTMGIALYDKSGNPITADVTDQVYVWDAGTEEDQPIGQGSNQAPRQPAPATGPADANPLVRQVHNYPVGKVGSSAAKPGDSLVWDFTPPKGTKLSFVTMFGQSNDWFFGTDTSGIDLWDADGNPVSGDITSHVYIWDAGTELDETPYSGPNQGPRQAGPNTGAADPDNKVRMVADTAFMNKAGNFIKASIAYKDGAFHVVVMVLPDSKTPISPIVYQVFRGRHAFFTTGMPDFGLGLERLAEDGNVSVLAANMEGYDFGSAKGNIQVTVTSLGGGRFEAKILTKAASVTPVAPGTYSIHQGTSPLFTTGAKAPEGLEALAEDANPAGHLAYLAKATGVYSPMSPVVWVVTDKKDVLFSENLPDSGNGLERLAEDGNPATLAAYLKSKGYQSGMVGTAPIANGGTFSFDISAEEGQSLHFASMYGQSNDTFFGPDGYGIALFAAGAARSGDVSAEVSLWDAGTEVNEFPGVGPNQAARQGAPNTGTTEGGVVKKVVGTAVYPAAGDLMEVTLAPK